MHRGCVRNITAMLSVPPHNEYEAKVEFCSIRRRVSCMNKFCHAKYESVFGSPLRTIKYIGQCHRNVRKTTQTYHCVSIVILVCLVFC